MRKKRELLPNRMKRTTNRRTVSSAMVSPSERIFPVYI